jgi:hypothetical protein
LFAAPVRLRRPRTYRQYLSPIDDYNDDELRARYRFGRDSIDHITNLIRADLTRATKRGHSLDPTTQVT